MKLLFMAALPSAIALASMGVNAQQSPGQASATPPGLYVTVSQGEVYIVQGDQQLDLKVGDAVYAGADSLQQLDSVPAFLNWPCGDSDLIPTYSLATLPAGNQLEEIITRFFEGYEIPASAPVWLNGESHGSFPDAEINRLLSGAYWYKSGPTTAKMKALRPKVLLISLYPATQQVIVDQNHLQELRDLFGPDNIPVTFVFNEENVVPVSFFGKKVSVQHVVDSYLEKGITIADVPMWYGGDRQLEASPGELELTFDIPALEDIDPDRLAALVEDLRTNGFTKKPINVLLMAQNGSMVIDEGDKVRAAQVLGITSIPIVIFNYDEDSNKKRCGLTTPLASRGGIGSGGVATALDAATPVSDDGLLAGREPPASEN